MSVHPSVCLSVRQSSDHPSIRASVFYFRMITWVNIIRFSPDLVCALILWRSELGLLMGKFHQILTELSAGGIFLFPDNNLCKSQGIITKLVTCIDIKETWLGIANGQILPVIV